jgi:hypothetical protein
MATLSGQTTWPHDGWLDMAVPFIAAHKADDSDVTSHIIDGTAPEHEKLRLRCHGHDHGTRQ